MGETIRTHLILPRELVERVDKLVGPRRRSEFVAEVLQKELDRRHLVTLFEAAMEEARNAPPDGAPPEWESAESAAEWVRAQRRIGEDPWARFEKEQ